MQITSNIQTAAEFLSFDNASTAAGIFETRHGYDTRIDTTPDGYVVRVLDEEGDNIGWLEEGTIY